jgi:hypothetical protein
MLVYHEKTAMGIRGAENTEECITRADLGLGGMGRSRGRGAGVGEQG